METKSNYPLPCMLYDSECILCTRFKQALEKLPGTECITMVSIYDESVYSAYPKLDQLECQQELHIIDAESNIHTGPEAIGWLIKKFPGTSKFTWLIESEMGQKAIDYFYNMADKYREKLKNRCPGCNKKDKNHYTNHIRGK